MSANSSSHVTQNQKSSKIPNYLLSVLGVISALTLLLPLLPILPDIGRKTQVMAVIVSLLFFMGTYMQRRALWEGELRRSVRGAAGRSVRFVAMLTLVAAMAVGFFLAADGASFIKDLLPGILSTRFIIPILQIGTFAGLTFTFSILAALDYMSRLERSGAYQRPPYLREEVDLPDLAADLLRANLRIPNGVTWKIDSREQTSSGGLKLTISWIEEVERTTSRGEVVKLLQERKYVVQLDVRGRILSFRELTG
jgi:hypothetical protein